jgi:hypothetical protein
VMRAMKVSPPGSVNAAFGSPIRDERPAARMTAGILDVRTTLLYLLPYACLSCSARVRGRP